MRIEINSIFGGWKEVDKEEALEYCKFLYKSICTMQDDEKVDYINRKKVRGIQFTEKELKA